MTGGPRLALAGALALACAHGGRTGEMPAGCRGSAVGMASFYGSQHQGHRTANGDRYDERELTCAHRTCPFGTRLKVTDLATGRSVVVEVNDRGPYAEGRVVDLSRAAARKLGILDRGVARVRLEPVP